MHFLSKGCFESFQQMFFKFHNVCPMSDIKLFKN
jgi:hypothetical protein